MKKSRQLYPEVNPDFVTNPELIKFVRYLFTRQMSAFLTIFGRRELGKTNLSLYIAEILYYFVGFEHIATNVKILNDTGIGITAISNLDDLIFWCKEQKGRKLFIFDEIGRSMPRRSPMARLNVQLINEFQVLRKYKLSIIACTIDPKYVDNSALGDEILDGCFIKEYTSDVMLTNQKKAVYSDQLRNFTKELEDLPKTNIKFDTWSTAQFTLHGPLVKPEFKDKDKAILWDWSHGKTAKEIGVSRMQIHRLSVKFIKEILDRDSNK